MPARCYLPRAQRKDHNHAWALWLAPCAAGDVALSEAVPCCLLGDICLEGGICENPTDTINRQYYYGGCTDPSYPASKCPKPCGEVQHVSIHYEIDEKHWRCCVKSGKTTQYNEENCIHPPGNNFSAPAPNELKTVASLPTFDGTLAHYQLSTLASRAKASPSWFSTAYNHWYGPEGSWISAGTPSVTYSIVTYDVADEDIPATTSTSTHKPSHHINGSGGSIGGGSGSSSSSGPKVVVVVVVPIVAIVVLVALVSISLFYWRRRKRSRNTRDHESKGASSSIDPSLLEPGFSEKSAQELEAVEAAQELEVDGERKELDADASRLGELDAEAAKSELEGEMEENEDSATMWAREVLGLKVEPCELPG